MPARPAPHDPSAPRPEGRRAPRALLPLLLALAASALAQPMNRPPQGLALQGTVIALDGRDLDGAFVVACFVVDDRCDEARSRQIEVVGAGASAPFSFADLEAVAYDLFAVLDVDGDGDYFGPADLYGEVAGPVVPPSAGLEVRLGGADAPAATGSTGSTASGAALDEVEPGFVKGRVVTSAGEPLSGVEVYADNTLYYDTNALAVTDADGAYRIDVRQPSGTWRVGVTIVRDYQGNRYRFTAYPEGDVPFDGASGAVRDVVWRLSGPQPGYGDYGGEVWVYPDVFTYPDDLEVDFDAPVDPVEITLVPDGPLVDGSEGAAIAFRGTHLAGVPIGRYTATATYAMPDGRVVPMLVRARGEGAYAPSASGLFPNEVTPLEFEIAFPAP